MKKKIVVRIPVNTEEGRREAMKRAVKVHAVESATIDRDKGQITVTGEGVDPVAVVKALVDRKLCKYLGCVWPYYHGVGPVNLVTVEDVKPEEKKPEVKVEATPAVTWAGTPYWYGGPPVMQVIEQPGGWW